MDTMASTKTRLGSLILIKVPTEVGGGSASIVKRCHGFATNQFRGKSIIFQSFVLAKNSGNASILVYIVPEPKNHCVVPTIVKSFYNFASAVKSLSPEFTDLLMINEFALVVVDEYHF